MTAGPKLGGGRRRRTRVIFVVGSLSQERERVLAALRGMADQMRQWSALGEIDCAALKQSAGVVVIAVDPTPTKGIATAIREFRSSDPATALALCLRPESRSIHQLATLARVGLDVIVRIDEPAAPTRLRQVVSRALKQSLPVDLVRQVMPRVPEEPAAICGFCFRNAFLRLLVSDVAKWFSCDETTLNRRLRAVGLRSAEHIIDLARLLHAALLLDSTMEKVHVTRGNWISPAQARSATMWFDGLVTAPPVYEHSEPRTKWWSTFAPP